MYMIILMSIYDVCIVDFKNYKYLALVVHVILYNTLFKQHVFINNKLNIKYKVFQIIVNIFVIVCP